MPRVAAELGALDVKRLRHPGVGRNVTFAVGGVAGLYLQITTSGARSWILRITVGSKRRDIGLGAYPAVSLAVARDQARDMVAKARRGIDPVEERRAAKEALKASQKRGMTFSEAARQYAAAKLDELATDRDRTRWRSMVARYTDPVIGEKFVDGITTDDVRRLLEPIWLQKAETARKLRSRIEAILTWATVGGHRVGGNPARWGGNLDALLPRAAKVTVADHHPAVALDEIGSWYAALRKRGGIAALAVQFLALTASRSGEVRGMAWAELDEGSGIWVIPAVRMKGRAEHRVPLCAEALAIIETVPRFADSPYVFPAPRGGQLSDGTLGKVMRDLQEAAEKAAVAAGKDPLKAGWRDPRSGRAAVPHGLRSTFRDWASERTDWPREMAEISLAHSVGTEVERAYRRGDMLEKRRAMMQEWASYLARLIQPVATGR